MFEYLYEWIQNIAFYMILITAAIQVLPDNGYKKYIRFFTGLILVMLLTSPILRLFNVEDSFALIYNRAEYQQQMREIEQATQYIEEMEESYLEQQE